MSKRVIRIFLVLAMSSLSSISYGSTDNAEDTREVKEMKLTVRMIGHKLLERVGDSISLVMPVERSGKTYFLKFQKDLTLVPDDLISLSNKYIETLGYKDKVIVQVKDCEDRSIVHSFEVNINQDDEMQPCQVRELPIGCYYVEFEFTGKSIEEDQIAREAYDAASGAIIRLFVFGSLFLIVVLLYRRNKKKKQKESDPNLIRLGKFYFNKQKTELVLEKQVIELTSKESDLLILLHQHANETVEREIILNVVWGDEGDYVGRTLDVFISKLRKKLEADPNVKITNVRGVGYRLVVSN